MSAPTPGLSASEARRRLAEHGPNVVTGEGTRSPWRILAAQLASPMIWLLLGACALSAALREVVDAVAILAIVVANAIVGFVQEFRAERALAALRSLTAPRARVVRDGELTTLPAAEVVVGDLLALEAGDIVAADAALVEAHALLVNEAMLTGESVAVEKRVGDTPSEAPLAERFGSVFSGTAVAAGTARAVVTATGMATELGKVATLLTTATQQATPLRQRLAQTSRVLLWAALAVVGVVAASGLLHGRDWMEVLLSSVSLAVAAVPEGLPAVVTIALAIGVQRMARRNVLVRRLAAVETLGCVTVICTDKTGTLTTGTMTVREVTGDRRATLTAAASCCDAELRADGTATGDPTEVALLRAAAELGVHRGDLEASNPRTETWPFDTEKRRMAVLRADGVIAVKGAVEAVQPLCTPASEESAVLMAGQGLRVLAVAAGPHVGGEPRDLTFVGFVGLADPPRPEATAAVAAARHAGVQVVMITGDHPATARAIATEMGILDAGTEPENIVHARTTPEGKLNIVRDWKARGQIVAMTGDGVNDAPALREAHVGVAMGSGGTEVTREAADIVLTDDNFASLVAGIHEGRGVFDNIRKALVFLVGGNAGELLVMLLASLSGLPLPLVPLHLLWINLVTDGFPALALAMEPVPAGVMARPPKTPGEPILGRTEWRTVLWIAVLDAGVTLGMFVWALGAHDLATARSLAFTTLVLCEVLRSFAARSAEQRALTLGLATNARLAWAVGVSIAVQFGLHLLPWTRAVFGLAPLGLVEVGLVLSLGAIPLVVLELRKGLVV